MDVNFPKLEEEVLERWKKEKTFEKSVALRQAQGKRFVFYEGPPSANGKPGIHHVLSRAFKDVVLRYKTMRGFFVERRAGWDTHGLPIELQIEKKLGLKSKKDIEKYGIAQFNNECKQSVWEHKKEWEALTERMGFWIDLKDPYVTYETSYLETLWFIIKTFWQKGLLYKGHKVVPYCSRCGTSLSSHELAQGYETVKDRSVFVKFEIRNPKFEASPNSKTYLLAWTTTPWTLPGNVALAVHPDLEYILAQKGGERYILAAKLAGAVLGEYKRERAYLGKELVGIKYEPLFRFGKPEKQKKVWEVVAADFVSTEEGTGIVHTAVAYGVEDFELGKKENLAMLHLVTEEGKFNNDVIPWKGMFVKDADPLIIGDLKNSGALLKEELYEHEYPFCWRCSTPLLYYAKDSWFVNMQKVKQALITNNRKINWVPAHLKEGRMGEWLKEVKDWAFSRERYWGTPLPIWECKKCEHREVIGSLEELREKTRSRNTYYILRHGHSSRQTKNIMSSWPEQKPLPLTKKGAKDIGRIAKELKKKKIDIILSSDLLRARQTAKIVGKELDLEPILDERLRDYNVGPALNGKHIKEFGKVWGKKGETPIEHYMRRFTEPSLGGESWKDVQYRVQSFMRGLEKKYQAKSVLLVSHELPLTMLEGIAEGRSRKDIVEKRMKKVIDTGELRILPYSALPLNEDLELDLHRPYIDGTVFPCSTCKIGVMQRVKEVADVWYDSGAMPFAQGHWPFVKNSKHEIRNPKPPELFPADYIVEGIDQTRGWFYTLLAVSTLLGFGAPYKNVISFSHVLDEKGEKMSKSKGNVVDPWDMIKKYGIDTVRWYFYTINNPGDPKLFSEKDIQEVLRKFILTLWNSFKFYETYSTKYQILNTKYKIQNILDQWILSRLSGIAKGITQKLDAYDIMGAGRSLENFVINDLSLWYIRRSRARFQNPNSPKEFQEASATLSFVLLQTSKLAAPFIPFLSEYIHTSLRANGSPSTSLRTSVHLEDFPQFGNKFRNTKLEQEMAWVRDLATKALAERAKAGIKVRQPLQELKVKNQKLKIASGLLELLKDELNVKEVLFDKNLKTEVELDIHVTPELKKEGLVREILRSIQEMRKEAGYKPQDKVALWYSGDRELCTLISKDAAFLKKSVGAKTLRNLVSKNSENKFLSEKTLEKEIGIEGKNLWLGITKT